MSTKKKWMHKKRYYSLSVIPYPPPRLFSTINHQPFPLHHPPSRKNTATKHVCNRRTPKTSTTILRPHHLVQTLSQHTPYFKDKRTCRATSPTKIIPTISPSSFKARPGPSAEADGKRTRRGFRGFQVNLPAPKRCSVRPARPAFPRQHRKSTARNQQNTPCRRKITKLQF